ncbi:MAG: hypothetical protein GY747_08410 [Planctomycetes bacterium]|nr:hypothetical protein [Planctomycetota bacterium]MCP4771206.1 hypothetical protein [Planctomycetota bacterium]
MNHSSHQTQLQAIDQAILALFQERLRLCESSPAKAAIDHMLRGANNAVSAEDIRALFALMENACDNPGGFSGANTHQGGGESL